ncbi:MAG: DUF4358 domain-containing protein [Clostridia bacterium]|nr:DUF4358 domain-containing protein [Clostridia bacterium]
MKMKLLSLILAAVTLLTFAACGETISYQNNISVTTLCDAATPLLSDADQMTAMTDDYISNWFDADVSMFADYAMMVRSSATNVDEYGIFKAVNEEGVKEVEQVVQDYLTKRDEVWMPEYSPEERPKVQNATVKVMGEYVVYGILSDSDKDAVFAAIENVLLGK